MSRPLKIDDQGNVTIQINVLDFFKIFVILALATAAVFLPLDGYTPASRACAALFVVAAGFWITGVVPPFATAILIIVISVYVFGMPGGLLGFDQTGYVVFLNPVASPTLVLFFGGLILALAASKHGLDVRLAKAFLKPFGTRPSMVLLAIILTTGVFSMFMSNTATTAMMIAIMSPLIARFEGRDPFKKAMVLAIPFAANIGGVGTIIGTPPNAVAVSVLASQGTKISFVSWMAFGVPLAMVMMLILWVVLMAGFKPKSDRFDILFPETLEKTWDLAVVVITFAVTLLLWLTEPLHGIPATVVSLLPVMVFPMFGIINAKDLKKLDWDVLILVAGGLTMGVAMKYSGFSDLLVSHLSSFAVPAELLLPMIVVFAMVLSNFMSNTSAANILIPIVISLSSLNQLTACIGVAFACSMAMSLPISTPPNALAFATHAIDQKEMEKYGTIVSLFGVVCILILLFVLRYIWQ